MITIYHNPRCSKSREGLDVLEKNNKEFTVVKYLEDNLSEIEIKEIIRKLGIKPIELVRTNESLWTENYKGKEYTDDEIISILQKNPKLIQRPIVVNGEKAVIARPIENINEIL